MASPQRNPVPWIIRKAQGQGGRGPAPRRTLAPLAAPGAGLGEEPLTPRALGNELTLEHRYQLGGGGWDGLLRPGGEEAVWSELLGLPVEAVRVALPYVDPDQRAVVRTELATARRRRWLRRTGDRGGRNL